MAPEQLGNAAVLERVRFRRAVAVRRRRGPLISEWGPDFRPDYLRLGAVIEELDHPTTLALTATAAPPVRDEICGRLRLCDPDVVLCHSTAHWGGGVVHGYDDGRVTVVFDAVGYRSRGLDLVAERALLEPSR